MAQWDVSGRFPAHTLKTQMAMNIYLSSAEEGGELELWNYGIRNEAQYEATKEAGDYGLSRAKIGELPRDRLHAHSCCSTGPSKATVWP